MLLASVAALACTGEPAPARDAAPPAARATVAAARRASDTLWLLAPPRATAVVGAGTTERALVAVFGAAAVRREALQIGEGMTEPGSVLFPDDPARRLEILWADTTTRERPARIRAMGRAWVAHPGIRIGSTLADVEASNGRPFMMTGFNWDYAGTVVSWQGGRLDSLPGGVARLLVRFRPPDDAQMAAAEGASVAGDRDIPSSHPVMRRIQPRVYALEVDFR